MIQCVKLSFLLTQMKVITKPARNPCLWHREPPGINEVRLSKRDPPSTSGERVGSCICVVVMFPLMDTKPQRVESRRKWKVFGWGPAVTLLPVPMTELQFPPELLKETVGCLFDSFLPLSLRGLFGSLCGLVTHTMLLFCRQVA